MAASIFGDAIAYDRVRIHNRKWWPFQPKRITMAPDGDLWFHPKGQLFCDDFCAADWTSKGLFIHEMVHVWQHQRGIFLPLARHPFCLYTYDFVPGKPFHKYGLEQQAEIVRHAFLLKHGRPISGKPPLEEYAKILPF